MSVGRGAKSAKIREVLKANPNMGNKEITAMVEASGIPCKTADVANIKQRMKMTSTEVTAADLVAFKATVMEHGGLDKLLLKVEEVKSFLNSIGSMERFQVVCSQYESLVA